MHSTPLVASECDVRLLIDLGERRVERLWEAIVEGARLAIVLSRDHDKVLHLTVFQVAHCLAFELVKADTRHVRKSFLSRHLGLLSRLNREGVLAFVPRMETPVSAL